MRNISYHPIISIHQATGAYQYMKCHDPSHGGFYMAEGMLYIRIGLPPRVASGDCLVSSRVDWLLAILIVAAYIRCLVIGVVLVCIVRHSMFLSCLCSPGGYTYTHMHVHFRGSLYPMMDFALRVWYGLSTPHVCWCSMGVPYDSITDSYCTWSAVL